MPTAAQLLAPDPVHLLCGAPLMTEHGGPLHVHVGAVLAVQASPAGGFAAVYVHTADGHDVELPVSTAAAQTLAPLSFQV